jgi:hypothetical protein
MRQFLLTLQAQESLILSDGSSESLAHQCLDYIPGNMILGAMAERSLRQRHGRVGRPDDDPDFRALFLDGSVSWGHAYPLVNNELTSPTPISFFRIKNGQDIPIYGSTPKEAAFIVNYLTWNGETEDLAKLANQARPTLKRCHRGFWDPQQSQCRPERKNNWFAHVALDPNQRKSIEGLLFRFSSLAAGARFQSPIWVADKQIALFQKLMAGVKTFRVGHGRSAGHGSVAVEALTEAQPLAPAPVTRAQTVQIFLDSDYLPLNSWENPIDSLLDELTPYIGQPVDDGQRRTFAQSVEIAGFNNLWRLPRPTRVALAKGSVISLTVTGVAKPAQPWPFFFGSGQVEGYGRLRLNPPFLLQPYFKIQTAPASTRAQARVNSAHPVFDLVRQRAIDREIQRLIVSLLYSKNEKFYLFSHDLDKSKMTTSQLGKIRNMITSTSPRTEWIRLFEYEMTKKVVAQKWRRGDAYNPGPGPARERLDIIARFLLAANFPSQALASGSVELKLPGGSQLSASEQAYFDNKFHLDFLLRLLHIWRQKVRDKN